MGAIKREMGGFNKWFWAAIGWECGWAYAIALIIFQVGSFAITGVFGLGTVVAFSLIAVLLFGLFRPMPRAQAAASDQEQGQR
jgi:ferrous iron transport protein B